MDPADQSWHVILPSSEYTRKTETLVEPRILEFRQMGKGRDPRVIPLWSTAFNFSPHRLAKPECLPYITNTNVTVDQKKRPPYSIPALHYLRSTPPRRKVIFSLSVTSLSVFFSFFFYSCFSLFLGGFLFFFLLVLCFLSFRSGPPKLAISHRA